jgi:hypothetical protein
MKKMNPEKATNRKTAMKITLITAASIKNKKFTEKPLWVIQPLTLAALAGLTPPHVEVQAIDDRIEAINYDEPRDLVGISTHTFSARRAYQIAAEFKKRGVPVILGGHHPTLVPDEALKYADSVLVGEAEGIWEDIVRDAERGQLRKLYRREKTIPLENFRLDRSVLAGKGYMPLAMVEATRGCPHMCDFCSVAVFYQRCFRFRPPDEVVAEIAGLKEKLIFFVDDNLVGDHEAAKNLFRALIPLKIHWIGQGSLQAAQDLELVRLMRESGCLGILAGIESLDDVNLKQMNKGWNTHAQSFSESLKIMVFPSLALSFWEWTTIQPSRCGVCSNSPNRSVCLLRCSTHLPRIQAQPYIKNLSRKNASASRIGGSIPIMATAKSLSAPKGWRQKNWKRCGCASTVTFTARPPCFTGSLTPRQTSATSGTFTCSQP